MLVFNLCGQYFSVIAKLLVIFLAFFVISCGSSSDSKTSTTTPVDTPTTPVVDPKPIEPEIILDKIIVNSLSPQNHDNNVSINSSIEIVFDKNIDVAEVEIDILLKTEEEVTVEGVVLINNNSLVFIPKKELIPETKYIMSIRSSDNSNKRIDKVEWDFITENEQIEEPRKSFFPAMKIQGVTTFTLQPIESVKEEQVMRISFGIPFPKGYLQDASKFRIIDSNNIEVPINVSQILLWQSDHSIRSVQVQLDTSFLKNEYGHLIANEYILNWGAGRLIDSLEFTNIRQTWVLVDDENYDQTLSIYEPKAYALFYAEWYGKSVIKNRLLPLYSHPDLSANDIAFKLFGDTAINNIDPRVRAENLIPFKTSYAAWLFDRAMTLYQLAFKSGEFKYFRAAHRASQFYLQNINDKGYFSLKPSNDMKYTYAESLLANYILVGDERIPETIERMIPVWEGFKTEYTLTSNFWTERHAAYQLLGFITAYELFGTETLENKVKDTFLVLRKMQIDPAEGIPITGGLMHTSGAHGEGGSAFIASPWMSTILIGAIERYYLNFQDSAAIDFVLKMADFFSQDEVSIHEWQGYSGTESYFVPHYLAGIDLDAGQHGGGGLSDLEHANDVTKIFALAYFFSCKTECDSKYLNVIAKLNNSVVTYGFPYWIRTSAPKLGLAAFRLAPPRKFSWWFQHTANNDFLLGEETKIPFYRPQISYKAPDPQLIVEQSHNFTGTFKPNDEITFTYNIKNISSKAARNILLVTKVLESSPSDLLEIVQIDSSAIKRTPTSVVWKFDEIEAKSVIEGLSFTIKVKDFLVLQSLGRSIGSIVSYVDVHYCSFADDESVCQYPISSYDLGVQTLKTQSNWQLISPIEPVTSPKIIIDNVIDDDVLDGEIIVTVQVEDPDGIDHVDFYLNNEPVISMKEPPFEYLLQTNALSPLEHVLSVKAWDVFGSEGETSVNFFAKNPDTINPIVNILTNPNDILKCENVLLQYSIEDSFSTDECELKLNQEPSILVVCGDYIIPRVLPLFSASAILEFEDETTINSTDEYTLIGEGIDVIHVNGGYVNGGLLFESSDALVDFNMPKLNIENNITVSFWLKPDVEEAVIMSQDWYYIGVERGWAISLGPNNHESNNPLSISWSSGNNGKNLNKKNIVQTASNSVELNTWQHVVVRKTNTLIDIFINGELSISQHITEAEINWPYNSEKIFSLGKAMKHPSMYNKNFQGVLDEVAIWDSAIDDLSIAQLYTRATSVGEHELTVTATDKAGNRGSASIEFKFAECN